MSTRIRLRRMGATKRPFYRVVVADQRSPRNGRFIEAIGKYHPLDDPSVIDIDEERALHWLNNGAQPSDTVQTLLDKIGIWEKYAADHPKVGVKADAKAKTDALKFKRGEAKTADRTKQEEAQAKAQAAAEAPTADAGQPDDEAPAETESREPAGDTAPAEEEQPPE